PRCCCRVGRRPCCRRNVPARGRTRRRCLRGIAPSTWNGFALNLGSRLHGWLHLASSIVIALAAREPLLEASLHGARRSRQRPSGPAPRVHRRCRRRRTAATLPGLG
ncbi:unnamed protein product, partial [Ectocarpus sp. 6 AP-2014]